MKNIKKITALVLTFAIMLSSITFVNAAGVSEEAKKLNQLGLLLNITEEEVSQNLNRVIGITMVLKSLGYKDADVASKASSNPFVDMDKFSWAKGFTAVAAENNITKGIGNSKFAPTKELSKKELLTFMLRVLGYDADHAWKNTEDLSRQVGILTDNSEFDSNFTKDDAARIMFRAMGAKLVNSDQVLVERLIQKGKVNKEDAIKVGLIKDDNSGDLKVVSVVADNLRQIKVVFNHELNAESAKKVSNYTLKGARGVSSRSISMATLSEDNKTVLLTVGSQSLQNKSNYVLTVKNVKDVKGQVISTYQTEFMSDDIKALEVVSVEFTGPKSFRINFSEPVQSVGSVEVKKGTMKISARNAKVDSANENVVSVETYSSFKDGETYTFSIRGMKDFAGYVMVDYLADKDYMAVTSTPTAEVVAADQRKVEVVFDRPVKGLTKKHFYHTFAYQTAKEIYQDAALTKTISYNEYVSKVWVVFATGIGNGNYPLPNSTDFTIMSKVDSKQIEDSWGNKFQNFSKVVNVEADKTAPQIDDIDVQSDSKIVITYNEDLSKAGTYRLKRTNGSLITSPSANLKGKKVTLTFTKPSNLKTAILEIKGVRDNSLNQNEMSEESRTIEFTDKTFAGPKAAEYQSSTHQIFVKYDEEVASNAIDSNNYQLKINGSNVVVNDQDFSYGNNNKTVVITLDDTMNNRVKNNLGNTSLVVSNKVTDISGNSFYGGDGFSKTLPLTGTTAASFKSAELVKNDGMTQIKLYFTQGIKEIVKNNAISFKTKPNSVYEGSNPSTLNELMVEDYQISSDNNSVVIVNLTRNIYVQDGLELDVIANAFVDDYDEKVDAFKVTNIKDKTNPTIVTDSGVRKATASKSGNEYYLTLKYTEPMNQSSFSSGTYVINGNDKLKITKRPEVLNNTVKITVDVEAGAIITDDITLTQAQSVNDEAGNQMASDNEVIQIEKINTWMN